MKSSSRRTSHLCPRCHKLISFGTTNCPHCGLRKPSSPLNRLMSSITAIKDGGQLVSLLIGINVVMFVLSLLLNIGGSSFFFHPMHFLSPSNQSLLILGSTGTIPLFQFHRWWSLITATYLHGGLLHILFNMIALRQLIPLVVGEFGMSRTISIYTLSGIGGYLLSSLAGIRFTIGASAAICGLIGALLYYGKSRGGIYGQNVFRQIGGWAISIIIFGFLMPGINNWGHIGGMVFGWIMGYLLGYNEQGRVRSSHRTLSVFCLLITAVALAWSCLNGAMFIFYRLG